MNILVLGHKGMLGHMVYKILGDNTAYNISTTNERFPDWDINRFKDIDYIINCIGAIPQKTNKFDINYQIPIWLNENTNCKIIHPSTDCEGDGSDYGLSKTKATNYIKEFGKNTKIIKTSIIGPELNSNVSLLEWFLSQRGKVKGYTKAIWNGITTLEWAKYCINVINNWDNQPNLVILYSNNISKFNLLITIQECYGKRDVTLIPSVLGKDKSLKGNIKIKDIREQILDLIRL